MLKRCVHVCMLSQVPPLLGDQARRGRVGRGGHAEWIEFRAMCLCLRRDEIE